MSTIFDHKTVSLALLSAFASQQAKNKGKSPSKWIERVKEGIKHIFPDLNYMIYEQETINIKKEGLDEIIFEDSFIVGKSLYIVILFTGGSFELPTKYLNSRFFAYGGPKNEKKEKVLKPRKVLKLFTLNSSSWKLIFENDKTLNRTEVFEKAYNYIQEKVPNLKDLIQKAEEKDAQIVKEIQEKMSKQLDNLSGKL